MEEATHTPTPDTRFFRDVFNASPIGIAVENLDGQPLFVNHAFCSMLGSSEEELCSKHCVDFSPPEDAERDWALFQQLRAGSIDHYQMEKRYFRRDGSLVWGNLSISLLKGGSSPLVLAIVEDITDKKRAEEGRSRHVAIVDSSEDAIASVTLDGVIESWNSGAQRIFGYTQSEAVGMSVNVLVPPELPEEENKILEKLKAGGRIDQFETVRLTKMGKKIDVSLSISPIKDSTGKTVGFSGISRDITDRKRAEQALSGMARKLIESQEQERKRIGRELHDDISQRLAILAIELELLQSNPLEMESRLQQLREETIAIASDVQALSHELHSSKLEYLGVVSAMKGFCKEFSERQKMEVDFRTDASSPLPFEIGLSLFRVLQEALHNAAKHSGAKHVEVQVAEHSNEIHLLVRDSGRGFDLEAAKRGNGLGLTSMQERLKLVSGQLSIESKPQEGTTIHARVPLSPKVSFAAVGQI
ncbi:MAG TPA: PAS domain S-box protein [Candidatus Acidoferrum sp.]|nr:PAS domain S-box protein [Candidatus Acidoferrum sp.]